MHALQSIPFNSIFSGLSWGVLSNAHSIAPVFAKEQHDKDGVKIVSTIFSTASVVIASTALDLSSKAKLSIAGLYAVSYFGIALMHRTSQAARVFTDYQEWIILALNTASIAAEMRKGQLAYPLARLTVTAIALVNDKMVEWLIPKPKSSTQLMLDGSSEWREAGQGRKTAGSSRPQAILGLNLKLVQVIVALVLPALALIQPSRYACRFIGTAFTKHPVISNLVYTLAVAGFAQMYVNQRLQAYAEQNTARRTR